MERREQMAEATVEIPIRYITPARPQDVSQWRLAELARSLARHGLQHPISVRENFRYCDTPNPVPSYIILDGENRYRAALLLGWETISAVVTKQSDIEALRESYWKVGV